MPVFRSVRLDGHLEWDRVLLEQVLEHQVNLLAYHVPPGTKGFSHQLVSLLRSSPAAVLVCKDMHAQGSLRSTVRHGTSHGFRRTR